MKWDEGRLAWLSLASFDGFSSKTLIGLATVCANDGARAWDEAASRLRDLGCHMSTVERFLAYRGRCRPEALVEDLDRHGVRFLLKADADFPFLLSQISDPPFALFVRGAGSLDAVHPVAVVGTRCMSAYGKQCAERIAGDLASAGATIVSGLALGIDAAAHRATLARGGNCIAVLGSGCDDGSAYPRSNLGLLRDIIAGGGAVISEYPPGSPGLSHHFPMRNRIIAGLSKATTVIEASTDSGSLITAHLALQYDRDVFAVPGPITDARSAGANKLLSLGARVCTCAADILPSVATSPKRGAIPQPVLSEDEKRIVARLREEMHIDDLSRAVDMPIRELAARLCDLELRGVVTCKDGDIYGIS